MTETNELSADRRRSYGRRATDNFNLAAMRGFVHDVTNSVGANECLIASMLEGDDVSPAARRRLSLVHREQQWLLAFLSSFLDQNRAAAVGPVDVRELLESVAALAEAASAARVTVVDGPDATVTVDAVALWRTVHNLVGNAVRAAGSGGHVEIVLTRSADTVRIDIIDSGPGFGSAPRGRESLGLELVTALLTTHGGRARLVQGAGPGTRVRVELPVAGTTSHEPRPTMRPRRDQPQCAHATLGP